MATALPVADVLVAIKQHKGNISHIAEQFGVKRSVIYLKLRSKPTLNQALIDERERWKDLAERNVHDALVRGERWATMFVLTTIAKDRGWALPKNGIFTDGKSSSINVQSISITTFRV